MSRPGPCYQIRKVAWFGKKLLPVMVTIYSTPDVQRSEFGKQPLGLSSGNSPISLVKMRALMREKKPADLKTGNNSWNKSANLTTGSNSIN